jgi:hypothetical protein
VPVVCSLTIRGTGLLVDAVNVHLTPVIAANRFLRGAAGEQGQKETSATTIIVPPRVEVKRPGRHGKSGGEWQRAPITDMQIPTPTIPPLASGLPSASVTLVLGGSLLSRWCAHGCGAEPYGVPAQICGMLSG